MAIAFFKDAYKCCMFKQLGCPLFRLTLVPLHAQTTWLPPFQTTTAFLLDTRCPVQVYYPHFDTTPDYLNIGARARGDPLRESRLGPPLPKLGRKLTTSNSL